MPNGYRCIKSARPRSDKAELTMVANHSGVYIFFRSRFTVHRISLPHHQLAEVLAVYVQGGGVNLIVIVIYRPGSRPVDSAFFREFATIVEWVASMVVVVGDVNIHLDDPTSPSTNNFNDIILGCDLRQLVTRPTHEAGHTLVSGWIVSWQCTITSSGCLQHVSTSFAS